VPAALHISTTTLDKRQARVDVLSFFTVIRNAYANHSLEASHRILEKHLLRFVSKQNAILYIDGDPAQEKLHTAAARKAKRQKAATRCEDDLKMLNDRIEGGGRVRKQHFTAIKSSLASMWLWSAPSRQAFIEYMQDAGWTIRPCETEADVAIGSDCTPDDVVLSTDSDMIAYPTIFKLWRPISNSLLLEYTMADICTLLNLSRAQLTALAVVSSNDYNRNIYSLGPATNLSIFKSFESHGNIQTPCK